MICPHCTHEVPDSSMICPVCEKDIPSPVGSEKDERRHFSHYRVILKKPGPRKKIVSILCDTTGLREKEVQERLNNLPWVIIDRKPLNEAQEVKILLEMNKADVELKGIDIWAEENEMPVENKSTANVKKPLSRLKMLGILASVVVVTGILVYLLTSITDGGTGGLLQKMGSNEQNNPESGLGIRPTGDEEGSGSGNNSSGPYSRLIERQPKNFTLRFLGPNPYSNELYFSLQAKKEIKVTVKIYDKDFYLVTTLLNRTVSEGEYQLRWRGITSSGRNVVRGLYFIESVTSEGRFYYKIIWLAE